MELTLKEELAQIALAIIEAQDLAVKYERAQKTNNGLLDSDWLEEKINEAKANVQDLELAYRAIEAEGESSEHFYPQERF